VALARFFGVSAEYFFDDADLQRGISAQALAAFRNDRAREVALRSIGLSERSIKIILEMIENARPGERAGTRASGGQRVSGCGRVIGHPGQRRSALYLFLLEAVISVGGRDVRCAYRRR